MIYLSWPLILLQESWDYRYMLLHLTFYMGAGALIHVIQLPQQALLSTETSHGPQTSCHSSPSLREKKIQVQFQTLPQWGYGYLFKTNFT